MIPTLIEFSENYGDDSGIKKLVKISSLERSQNRTHIFIEYEGDRLVIPIDEINWFIDAIDKSLQIAKETQ